MIPIFSGTAESRVTFRQSDDNRSRRRAGGPMNSLRFVLAVALCAGTALGIRAQDVPAKPSIALPSDSSAVVIEIRYHPTMWSTTDTPLLVVHADGQFVAYGSGRWPTPAEGKIPADELQDVLR